MNELQIFLAANRLPTEQRESFIEASCAKNPQLLAKVRALNARSNSNAAAQNFKPQDFAGKKVVSRAVGHTLVAYLTTPRLLDEQIIQQVADELMRLVPQCAGHELILNFREVDFMSSAMLGKILALEKSCRRFQVELRLCELNNDIASVFKLMKLNSLLHIDATEDKALKQLAKIGQ